MTVSGEVLLTQEKGGKIVPKMESAACVKVNFAGIVSKVLIHCHYISVQERGFRFLRYVYFQNTGEIIPAYKRKSPNHLIVPIKLSETAAVILTDTSTVGFGCTIVAEL